MPTNYDLLLQDAVESLLENESLTDNLDDETAQVLIQWGIEKIKQLIYFGTHQDFVPMEEYTQNRLRSLNRTLRLVNRWLPEREYLGREDHQEQLQTLISRCQEIFDEHWMPIQPEETQEMVEASETEEDAPFVAHLTTWVDEHIHL